MGGFKNPDFRERKTAADKARTAALERFKARPGPDDPAYRDRQAARQVSAAAREARDGKRRAERESATRAAHEAEEVARTAAVQRDAETRAAHEAEEVARAAALQRDADQKAALLAEQKAGRDARYAARKARKR